MVFGKVQIDVENLGEHFDFIYRAREGALSHEVGKATVELLGWCITFGFTGISWAWFVVSIFLLAEGCPHAAEASYVFPSSISAFRAAIVRAVWPTKMPLANFPAFLRSS